MKGDGFVLMSDAARDPTSTPMAGFSFPSFYYRKDLKVFKSPLHRCILNKITLSLSQCSGI